MSKVLSPHHVLNWFRGQLDQLTLPGGVMLSKYIEDSYHYDRFEMAVDAQGMRILAYQGAELALEMQFVDTAGERVVTIIDRLKNTTQRVDGIWITNIIHAASL